MNNNISIWLADELAREDDVLEVEGSGVGFGQAPPPNSRLIVDGKFNKEEGALYLTRFDGEDVVITGFVMPVMLEGKRGRRGDKGKKGKNGKDGRDGKKGDEGCGGLRGPDGKQGAIGATGATGDDGDMGATGPTGPTGNRGATGATGYIGSVGARGNRGAGCLTGPVGSMGLKPIEVVVVQTNRPAAINVHIWGEPDTPIYGQDQADVDRDPPIIEFDITPIEMEIRAPSNDSSDGTFFTGTGVSNIVRFKGGVGPFNYQWSGDYENDAGLVYTVGQRGRSLSLTASANVPPEGSKLFEGRINLTITDEGHPDRRKYTAEATYSIRLINPSDTNVWSEQVWQPRRGSIVFGVRADTTGGLNVKVEQLLKNETLVGMEFDGMGDDWQNWQSTSITSANSRRKSTTITEIVKGQANSYIQINNLKILPDKYIFVRRMGVWIWVMASQVRVDDFLFKKGGTPEPVRNYDWINETVLTVSIDTEAIDCFFLEHYLVHD